ncbi:MAG TPA: porin family protein [Flavisolibacter sp.]
MKKIIFFLAAVLLTASAFSQRASVAFGLKAGINISDFNDDAGTTGRRTGFHLGGLAHFHLNPNFAIQPEIVYSTQGAERVEGEYQINYINIPMLFQYMTASGFRLETGPQIGVLTSAEREESDGDVVNVKPDLRSSDISWAIGAGYLSRSGLGVDARYNIGLTDIRKGSPEWEHRVWQFGIFYQFRR